MKYAILLIAIVIILVGCGGRTETPQPTTKPQLVSTPLPDSIVPDSSGKLPNMSALGIGSPAYGIVVWEDQKLVFINDIYQLNNWKVLKMLPGTMFVSGDFVGEDYQHMYVINYLFDTLEMVDVDTGVVTRIGEMKMYTPTGGWTGLTSNKNGVLYATSVDGYSSYLYTVNIQTAQTTFLGKIGDDMTLIDIALTDKNQMFGLDIHTDRLFRIDVVTYKGFPIGSIGFDANSSQDMDYDENTMHLYLSAYNRDTRRGELRMADINTGATTLVGVFPNGDEVSAFSFIPSGVKLEYEYLPTIVKAEGE